MIRRNAERSKKCDREEDPPALQLPEKAVFFIYDKHPQEETMDIRQLHYFLVLCEEMNYTRAAQRLFLSRQALRQSISALEAELCGPLFLSAHQIGRAHV